MSVGDRVQPEYQATSTIMYVEGPAETELPNPYGSLPGANQVASIVLNSIETRTALAAAGHEAAYEVAAESRSSITYLSMRSTDAEDAVATGTALIEAAQRELTARQEAAGIPENARVGLQVLEQPTIVAAVQEGKLRIQAVVGVVGGGIALLVAVLFDDIIGLWKRARAKGSRRSQKRARGTDKARPVPSTTPDPSHGATDVSASDGVDAGKPIDAPRTDLPRRGREPARADTNGPADSHASGLGTASPSINGALITTNEWLWPGDHSREEALERERRERPRRNPFFDPEFTKRQLAKTQRSAHDTSVEPSEPETTPKR